MRNVLASDYPASHGADTELTVRKASMPDIHALLELINGYAAKGVMLPRTEFEMSENIRDFTLAFSDGATCRLRRAAFLFAHQRRNTFSRRRSECEEPRHRPRHRRSFGDGGDRVPAAFHLRVHVRYGLFREARVSKKSSAGRCR